MRKTCIRCKEKKLETLFGGNGKNSKGIKLYRNVCRACLRISERKKRVSETPEQKRTRLDKRLLCVKKRRKKTPEVFMLQRAKKRAIAKGLPFNLTLADLKIPKVCPILGIPIFVGDIHIRAHSPSLDRRDNSKGYTKDNIGIISYKANGFKGDMNIEDVKKLLKYMQGGKL